MTINEDAEKVFDMVRGKFFGSTLIAYQHEQEAIGAIAAFGRRCAEAMREALEESDKALGLWMTLHAQEFCTPDEVEKAREFMKKHEGTLAYLCDLRAKNEQVLRRVEGK